MEYVHTLVSPPLRDPVLIAAFSGWNDASEVATFTARVMMQQWAARRMATMDAEEFYVFTETRPQVRTAARGSRRVVWPANEFFFHTPADGERDYVLLIGVEPQLKWRTFTSTILDYCQSLGVKTLVTLGGLVAEVAHTSPVHLSGSATPAALARRLRRMGVETAPYQGPTGILGVLSASAAARKMATANIWGSVPEYLSATPNPKVALALTEVVSGLLDLRLDYAELEGLDREFERQVAEVLAEDSELQAYVQQLEDQERSGRMEVEEPQSPVEGLPNSEELIRDVEEFLRKRRRQSGRTA